MPKGPHGEKRPADVIGTAIKVAKIATGEIEEELMTGKEYARKGGLIGGKARAEKLSPKRRKEIARKAAKMRWSKKI
ncbi:MAG: RNA-binding protein [Nitrospirae bacterium RBG_13_41_22]|nr:MAG: RNA-binding protein [Nitrospirae bacterium RBG_13_41_22]